MLLLIQCIWFYLELISCFLLPFESEFPFMILVIIFIGGRMDIKIGLNNFFFFALLYFQPYFLFSIFASLLYKSCIRSLCSWLAGICDL